MHYLSEYIQRALTSRQLESPDKSQLNGLHDVAESIYYAHQNGGTTAAMTAWDAIKRMKPELANLNIGNELLIHADDLKLLSKPFYLLDGYPVYQYGFNILSGPSGSGKSFIALDIAGQIAKESPVVYIAGEGLHGYAARWEAWKDHNDVDSSSLYFYKEALQVMEQQQLESFIGMIRVHKPSLVIIDTLARSAIGIEENSAREMGLFVGACDYMRGILQCGLLIVHHTGISGRIRGSTSLYGAADSVIAVTMSDGRMTMTNNPERGGKNKHSEAAKDRYFQIIPHNVGDFAGAVLIEADQVIQTKEDKLTANQRLILEAIDGYDEGLTAQTIVNATALAQSTVYWNLKRLMTLAFLTFEHDRYSITEAGSNALFG